MTPSGAATGGGARWTAPAIAAAVALGVASLGGQLTDLGPWYIALEKPAWQPPGVAFPIVWTIIFTLTAIAGVVAWRATPSRSARVTLLALFALNAALNVLWSGLFFTLKRPDWALIEGAALWVSVVALIAAAWPRSRLAGALLVPYVIWVTIALVLNWEIIRLNGPFGA